MNVSLFFRKIMFDNSHGKAEFRHRANQPNRTESHEPLDL